MTFKYRISSIKRPGRLFVEMIFRGALNRRGRLFEGGRLLKINFLTNIFLKANKNNGIIAEVIGGRKRENGLVVPCLYNCRSKNKKLQKY